MHFFDPTVVASVGISGTQNLWHDDFTGPIGEEVDVFLTMPAMQSETIRISVDLILRDS